MHSRRQIGSHSLLGCVPFFPSDWKSGNITSGPVLCCRIRWERLNEKTGKVHFELWLPSRSSRNVKVPVVTGQGGLPKGRTSRSFNFKPGLRSQAATFHPQCWTEACFIDAGWTMSTYRNLIFVLDAFIRPGILKSNFQIIVLTPFYE